MAACVQCISRSAAVLQGKCAASNVNSKSAASTTPTQSASASVFIPIWLLASSDHVPTSRNI